MALDKDILGLALYNRREDFCNKTMQELIDEYGSFEGAKMAMAKADAEEIINHLKNQAVITLNPTGLSAGPNPVTGSAQSQIS